METIEEVLRSLIDYIAIIEPIKGNPASIRVSFFHTVEHRQFMIVNSYLMVGFFSC